MSESAPAPAVILVAPQLGENIGFCARAMLNFGLTELRLVAPRDGWPNPAAWPAAAGADAVLDNAKLYADAKEAVADLSRVFATTARPREMIKPVMTPRAAAETMRGETGLGVACGVLFGRERSGLDNDEVALADTIVTAPTNPDFTSLSIAQAVLMLAYEWWQAGDATPEEVLVTGRTDIAEKAELLGFLERLEEELDARGFLHVVEKKPAMIRNIRNIFQRGRLTAQEVSTLHGIVSCLIKRERD